MGMNRSAKLAEASPVIMLDRRTLVWPDRSEKGGVKSRSQTNIGAFLDHIGARLAFNELACCTVIRRAGRERLLTDEAAKGLWLEADALGLESSDSYFLAVLEHLAGKTPSIRFATT